MSRRTMPSTEEMYPGRLEKQPRWLRERIKALEDALGQAEAKLAAGPEDSEAWSDPHSSSPRPLGKKPVVKFGPTQQDWRFQVEYRAGQLHVHGIGATLLEEFVVMPRAANAVIIGYATPTEADSAGAAK